MNFAVFNFQDFHRDMESTAKNFADRFRVLHPEPQHAKDYDKALMLGRYMYQVNECKCDVCLYLTVGLRFDFHDFRTPFYNGWRWRRNMYEVCHRMSALENRAVFENAYMGCPAQKFGRDYCDLNYNLVRPMRQGDGEFTPRYEEFMAMTEVQRAEAKDAMSFLLRDFPAHFDRVLAYHRLQRGETAAGLPDIYSTDDSSDEAPVTGACAGAGSAAPTLRAPIPDSRREGSVVMVGGLVLNPPPCDPILEAESAGRTAAIVRVASKIILPDLADLPVHNQAQGDTGVLAIPPMMSAPMAAQAPVLAQQTDVDEGTVGAAQMEVDEDQSTEVDESSVEEEELPPQVIVPQGFRRLTWASARVRSHYDANLSVHADTEMAQQSAYALMAWHNCNCELCHYQREMGWRVYPLEHIRETRKRWLRTRLGVGQYNREAVLECVGAAWYARLIEIWPLKKWQ